MMLRVAEDDGRVSHPLDPLSSFLGIAVFASQTLCPNSIGEKNSYQTMMTETFMHFGAK